MVLWNQANGVSDSETISVLAAAVSRQMTPQTDGQTDKHVTMPTHWLTAMSRQKGMTSKNATTINLLIIVSTAALITVKSVMQPESTLTTKRRPTVDKLLNLYVQQSAWHFNHVH